MIGLWAIWMRWMRAGARRAIRSAPLPAEAVNRASELWESGRVREAIELLESRAKALPSGQRRRLARLCRRMRATWAQVCARFFRDAAAIWGLPALPVEAAQWELWCGRIDRAVRCLRQAAEQHPDDLAVRRVLAQLSAVAKPEPEGFARSSSQERESAAVADDRPSPVSLLAQRLEALSAAHGIRGGLLIERGAAGTAVRIPPDVADVLCRSAQDMAADGTEAAGAMKIGRLLSFQAEGPQGALHVTVLHDGLLLALADSVQAFELWEDRVACALRRAGAISAIADRTEPLERALRSVLQERGCQAVAVFDRRGALVAAVGPWPVDIESLSDLVDPLALQASTACRRMGLGAWLSGEFFAGRRTLEILPARAGQVACLCDGRADAGRLGSRLGERLEEVLVLLETSE